MLSLLLLLLLMRVKNRDLRDNARLEGTLPRVLLESRRFGEMCACCSSSDAGCLC